jgi:7,8-dihydropterin-6-yl-methyl-4-(beta-D-ribofuranosyl)aminobenzene 5'-phosphate synthase
MQPPLELDRLEVLVLVDNATDSLSTNPSSAVPEWIGLVQRGLLSKLSGEATCWAHHGLSLLRTAQIGREKHDTPLPG